MKIKIENFEYFERADWMFQKPIKLNPLNYLSYFESKLILTTFLVSVSDIVLIIQAPCTTSSDFKSLRLLLLYVYANIKFNDSILIQSTPY